ncbi:MAG TPA: manganese efflux pump [Clostridiaceae bacterium]|nr:manganese efflux pump [Clostridiaceae bacterium]
MDFYSLFAIALALSLDAFGVALCIGLNKGTTTSIKTMVASSFGFFQFLFSLIGALAGFMFTTYITSVPTIIGGALISIVGVMMLKEGMEEKEECVILKPGMIVVLGVSVSIDALVIGFTAFNNISSTASIMFSTLFIGVVSVVMSFVAFYLSRHLHKIDIVSKYADYIGGVILVLFGIKMMIS